MRGRSSRAARPTWSSFTATRSPIPPRSGASGGSITAACGSADRSRPERPPPLGFGWLVAVAERAVDRRLHWLRRVRDPADPLGDGQGVERHHRLLTCEGPSDLVLTEHSCPPPRRTLRRSISCLHSAFGHPSGGRPAHDHAAIWDASTANEGEALRKPRDLSGNGLREQVDGGANRRIVGDLVVHRRLDVRFRDKLPPALSPQPRRATFPNLPPPRR